MSETGNQSRIVRELSDRGFRLFRNNRGVLLDKRGVPVRYGLANTSEAEGRALKSGDLIGWFPRLVTPDMVGTVIAEFTSIEVKPDGWKPPGVGPIEDSRGRLTAYGHYVGQKRWADLVVSEGGQGGFMIDAKEGYL